MKILIAEDDATSRLLLQATLEMLGHEVTAAEHGEQALTCWLAGDFPVVISDWLMPRMNGLELCRAIRATNRPTYTLIIMLTSLGGKANYLEAIHAGADDFLTKPCDEEQLAARLLVAERILGLRHHVSQLEQLLPICAYCKKIRDDHDQWQPVEGYIAEHSEARTKFSPGIGPACLKKFEAELASLDIPAAVPGGSGGQG